MLTDRISCTSSLSRSHSLLDVQMQLHTLQQNCAGARYATGRPVPIHGLGRAAPVALLSRHRQHAGGSTVTKNASKQPQPRSSHSRLRTVRARAEHAGAAGTPGDGDTPLYLPATASTYCPFSAELLLATTRLGHLERYREELQQLYEPGQPVELTRVALLISNIYQPQLDHRPYFDALEHLVAAAAMACMRRVSALQPGPPRLTDDSCTGFEGLDVSDPAHVLAAIQAINELLFVEEGLGVNAADPYDPLNGSLADLLDTRKGNQWTLAVVYLHILDGLGMSGLCSVVGSPERIFVRVGTPPVLVQHSDAHTTSSSSTPPPVFLVDTQPGVVFGYPPPIPADSAAGSSNTLEPADSVRSDVNSTSSSARVPDEWNSTLHAFLQQHQQQQAANLDAAAAGDSSWQPAEAGFSSGSNSGMTGRSDEFAVDEPSTDDSSAWLELEAYAAQDAATRNSWKALYGPGALTEWGGSVSSNLHYYHHSINSSWDGAAGSEGGASATIGGMRAGEWLGVLDSPFAAAAAEPFPPEGEDTAAAAAEAEGGGAAEDTASSFSSMDTSCGSPAASVDLEEGDSGSGVWVGQDPPGLAVPVLTWADVAAMGGLQPVSKRVMLQQMLGGMKLSLMMSGRQEELLLVLRYLRATDPFSLPDLRDMALCLAEQRPEEAGPLLREYLATAPGAPDADMVGEVLAQVQLRVQLGRAKGWGPL